MGERKRDLALIHVAKKQLGLDDDTYRDVLWTVGKVRSAADLDGYGREQLLTHFKRLGFKVVRQKRRRDPGEPALGRGTYLGKIEAQLADMKLEWAYADGIARQMFGLESVRFCKAHQLRKIVAALTYRQKKAAKEDDHEQQ